MKTTLKVFSIFAVVIGALAIFGATSETTIEGAVYCIIGGGLFLAQGVLALVYIKGK